MNIKKPSVKGMKNIKYLGHFAKEKHLSRGHNDSGGFSDLFEPPQVYNKQPQTRGNQKSDSSSSSNQNFTQPVIPSPNKTKKKYTDYGDDSLS